MFCGTADLIAKTFTYDSIGNPIASETRRTIFTSQKSISRAEWGEAGRNGHKAEICLSTPECNFNGEEEVEYDGVRYGIYRTYCANGEIELYLERKGGIDEH